MRAADEIVKGIRFAFDVQKFAERWALLIINDRGMINNRESAFQAKLHYRGKPIALTNNEKEIGSPKWNQNDAETPDPEKDEEKKKREETSRFDDIALRVAQRVSRNVKT